MSAPIPQPISAKPIDLPTTHDVYVWVERSDDYAPMTSVWPSIEKAMQYQPKPSEGFRRRRRLFRLTIPLDALEDFS